jgi:hypothetical protein
VLTLRILFLRTGPPDRLQEGPRTRGVQDNIHYNRQL